MSHRLKVTIKNDSDYALIVADDAPETVLKAPSVLATGSNPLPQSVAPRTESSFTIATPISGPTPEGSIALRFDTLQLSAHLSWKNFIANSSNGASPPPDPCSWAEERLDGGAGDLNATIEYFDEKGGTIERSTLADKESQSAAAQESAMAKTMKDPQHPVEVKMIPIEVRFTLQVKVPATIGTAPSKQPAVAPAGAVRPTGSSKIIVGSGYPHWDSSNLPARRQKLLAAIGNRFPMVWDQKAGDIEPKSDLPYQMLKGWEPGKGTSCTNVAGSLENLLTGSQGKWGFAAHFIEDAWVPWGANPAKPMPSVGDVYLLYSDLERKNGNVLEAPQLRHVGFILHVPQDESESWVTADGGQNGKDGGKGKFGGGAFLNVKRWEKRRPIDTPRLNMAVWEKQMKAHLFASPIANTPYPYLAGGAESDTLADANRLIGWLDLDAFATPFLSTDFDKPLAPSLLLKPELVCQQANRYSQKPCVTEADFRLIGAWINAMLGLENELARWVAHIKAPATHLAPAAPEPFPLYLSAGSRYLPV